MNDSIFRELMVSLLRTEGGDRMAKPDYERIIRGLLASQFNAEMQVDRHYIGPNILIDRSNLENRDPTSERGACLGLYNQVKNQGDQLTIGSDCFRMIGYEVPNQGNFRGRRADLLATNPEGGLVLFECKLAGNSYGPFMAVLEGLDYLAALLQARNYQRVQQELEQPYSDDDELPPWTQLSRNTVQEVIVLATDSYFERAENGRVQDTAWGMLNDCIIQSNPAVRIRFATAKVSKELGYNAKTCKWIES